MENKLEDKFATPTPPDDRSSLEPVGNVFWDLSKILLLAVVIVIPLRLFVFQPFIVSGSSMEPNFKNGDYLIIDQLTYRVSHPKRGDVIVLRYPNDPTQFFIKRLVGLPGEKVEINNGQVVIYNQDYSKGLVLKESYLPSGLETMGRLTVNLSAGQYFVLGDNRGASSDSRSWGILPQKDLVGRVMVRVLPINHFSIFGRPHYSIQ